MDLAYEAEMSRVEKCSKEKEARALKRQINSMSDIIQQQSESEVARDKEAEKLRARLVKSKDKSKGLFHEWRSKAETLGKKVKRLEDALQSAYQMSRSQKETFESKLQVAVEAYNAAVIHSANPDFKIRVHDSPNSAFTPEFESHAKMLMATGISASKCLAQLEMDAFFFLGRKAAQELKLPSIQWLNRLRESIGGESWIYAFIKIAGCDRILQHGFDETGINRTATCNQWCLIETGNNLEIVVIEAGGILTGGTAEETKNHIKETWVRGNAAIEALRMQLGDQADKLVPLNRGGVRFLKVCLIFTLLILFY